MIFLELSCFLLYVLCLIYVVNRAQGLYNWGRFFFVSHKILTYNWYLFTGLSCDIDLISLLILSNLKFEVFGLLFVKNYDVVFPVHGVLGKAWMLLLTAVNICQLVNFLFGIFYGMPNNLYALFSC